MCLTGAFSVLYRPRIESGSKVTTDDDAKAGVSLCPTSQSRRAVSRRSLRKKAGVPTPSCRSFRGLSGWRATCSRTGTCHNHLRCFATIRVVPGDGATLPGHRRRKSRDHLRGCGEHASRRRSGRCTSDTTNDTCGHTEMLPSLKDVFPIRQLTRTLCPSAYSLSASL